MESIGGGSAYNIRLSIKNPFQVAGDTPLAEVGPFKTGLTYLAPRQRLETFLANAIGREFEEILKMPLDIEANYTDEAGRAYHNTFSIDFGQYNNITRIGEPPLYTIAESLKNFDRNFSNLLNGMSRLHVLAYSVDDAARESSANKLWHKFRRLGKESRAEVETLLDAQLAQQDITEENHSV